MLTKEQILAAIDVQTKEVPMPGTNDVILLRQLTGTGRDAFVDTVRDRKETSFFSAALLVATVVDANGAPMFTNDDIDALRGLPASTLGALADASAEFSGLVKAAAAQ